MNNFKIESKTGLADEFIIKYRNKIKSGQNINLVLSEMNNEFKSITGFDIFKQAPRRDIIKELRHK